MINGIEQVGKYRFRRKTYKRENCVVRYLIEKWVVPGKWEGILSTTKLSDARSMIKRLDRKEK